MRLIRRPISEWPSQHSKELTQAAYRAARSSQCCATRTGRTKRYAQNHVVKTVTSILATLTLSYAGAAQAQEFKVIAHPSVAIETISRADLSRIFLKKQLKWPNGVAVVPVDLPIDSPVRASFSQAVHQKGANAVDAYWQKQIFSGRDLPPVVKSNSAEVVSFVKATNGAVGYVASDASTSGLKLIAVQ